MKVGEHMNLGYLNCRMKWVFNMIIRDRQLKHDVDVCCKDCPTYQCYWPRPDPGVFVQGQGYRQTDRGRGRWLCGTREIQGCPENPMVKP